MPVIMAFFVFCMVITSETVTAGACSHLDKTAIVTDAPCGTLEPIRGITTLTDCYSEADTKRAPGGCSFRHRRAAQDLRSDTASTTHRAVMLTMRRTVADGVRMCTGRAQPSRIGPTAMPLPAAVFTRL